MNSIRDFMSDKNEKGGGTRNKLLVAKNVVIKAYTILIEQRAGEDSREALVVPQNMFYNTITLNQAILDTMNIHNLTVK